MIWNYFDQKYTLIYMINFKSVCVCYSVQPSLFFEVSAVFTSPDSLLVMFFMASEEANCTADMPGGSFTLTTETYHND